MLSVLFVCTANICRSPMAEGLFKAMVSDDPEPWRIESAGVWASPGQPAASLTRQVLLLRGLELNGFVSRPITRPLIKDFNLILTMERNQKEALRAAFPEYAERVMTIRELIGKSGDIEDPVLGTYEDYAATAEELESILRSGFEQLRRLAAGPPGASGE